VRAGRKPPPEKDRIAGVGGGHCNDGIAHRLLRIIDSSACKLNLAAIVSAKRRRLSIEGENTLSLRMPGRTARSAST
jgi:hypothetical protein